ncbi:MAG TPA: hypothetical protein VF297_16140 [Pyrinomonadaceae bacterium]
MSRKNNVNTDHYKTDGRKHSYTPAASGARSGSEGLLAGARARQSAETRMADHRRLQRRRRLTRLRGLSAKRLSERRRLQRQAGLCQGVSPGATALTIKKR